MSLKKAVLVAAKSAGLFALMRALTRKRPRILCYHGGNLGDERHYNPKLFCTTEQLRQRLDWLRSHGFAPATLDETLEAGDGRAIPVAVTLDDGWYSSWRDLLPVLAEYGYRPVLYLHSEAYEQGGPIAGVALRYLVWKAPRQPRQVAGFGPDLDGGYDLAREGDRRMLVERAEHWLRTLAPRELEAGLVRLAEAVGVPAATLDLASRRFSYMTRDELHQAATNGCAIELHGHVHAYVPGELEVNRANIERCRESILAAGLPNPVHYCYPSGRFDPGAASAMRAAGVRTATTCLPGLVKITHPDDAFFLPRFLDGGNVSMIEFEAEMSGVSALVRKLASLVPGQARAGRPAMA
ncbi:polysaccharide deacetylase family protein [Massilia sp. GCM10023247]|uniref:polysaccharide deacetylase family protein n=1 Tax=Massilia sp. GCM10023247 TaxID=3252643 RepID=UPI0036D2F4BD